MYAYACPHTFTCTRSQWFHAHCGVSLSLTVCAAVVLFKGSLLLFQPLDDAVLSELKTVLKSFLSPNQILKLEIKVGLHDCGVLVLRPGLHIPSSSHLCLGALPTPDACLIERCVSRVQPVFFPRLTRQSWAG